jgi:P4 family phage/plasmid primase-like protien
MSDELRDILEQQLRHMSDPSPMELVGPIAGDLPDGVGVAEAKAVAEELCDTTPEAHPSGKTLYPDALQAREWWVNWVLALPFDDEGEIDTDAKPTKQPVAPYDNGHAKPTRWHAGLSDDEHPSTAFETVNNWEGLSVNVDIESHERVLSDELGVGIIIPVGGGEGQQVTLLDWDDVRDPETGDVHPVCADALERCDGFAEISQSGEGIHQFVFGEIPAGMAKFLRHIDDEPFVGDDLPMIEMYNSGRLTAMTGTHVEGAGEDVVEGQDLIDDLCWRFGTADNNNEGTPTDPFASDRADQPDTPSHEAVGDELREAVAYDADDPAEWDIPEDEPLDYHAVLRAREREPEMVNTANWELLGYAAALAADNDIPKDQLIEDLRSHDRPGYEFDESKARKETRGVFRKAEAGGYEPPSRETLVERGILPKEYDPAYTEPPASSVDSPETAETDGGTAVEDGGEETSDDVTSQPVESAYAGWKDIRSKFREAENAEERAGPRFDAAMKLHTDHSFANLQENEQLYVYDPDKGIYEDDGTQLIRSQLTQGLEEQYRGHTMSEVEDHIRGRNTMSQDEMGGPSGMIAARNCVIDLDEETRRDHKPKFMFQSRLGCEFEPDAECPQWRAFLDDAVPNDTQRRKLQEFAGYCLHHWDLPYHKALFLVGPTASGKSTFLDTINRLLGDGTVASLTPQQLTSERFGPAELFGKWANIRNDIPKSTVKNTGMFKELIAGDPMKAERKNKDPFFFNPTAKHLFSANQLPEMETDDEAFFRRILLVPFPETVPEPERDKHLDDKLQAELPGILNWAVAGLQRLLGQGGFTGDRSPAHTRETWSKWGDSVSRFAKAAIEEGDEDIPKAMVYAAYLQYCREESIPSDTQHAMTRQLKQEGYRDGKAHVNGKQERCFYGVSWTGRGEELLNAAQSDDDGGDGGRATGLTSFD